MIVSRIDPVDGSEPHFRYVAAPTPTATRLHPHRRIVEEARRVSAIDGLL
jgi:hypothetical protein